MANHNNYANDRDLMMEAYASVKGEVPATSSTAMPRMFNEAHCDEEHKGKVKFTLQGVGGYHGQTLAGDGETFDSLEEVCAAAGVDVEECKKAELWDDMGDGTKEFGVDEDTVIIMHAEDAEGKYPAEDGGCAAHSDEEHSEDEEHSDEDVEQMCKEWLKKKWLSFKAEHSEGHEGADELNDAGMLNNWEEVMREYVSDWVEEVVEELS